MSIMLLSLSLIQFQCILFFFTWKSLASGKGIAFCFSHFSCSNHNNWPPIPLTTLTSDNHMMRLRYGTIQKSIFSNIFLFPPFLTLLFFISPFVQLFMALYFIATFSFFLMRCAISVLFLRILYKKKFDNVFGFHCSCTFIFIPYCGVCIPV